MQLEICSAMSPILLVHNSLCNISSFSLCNISSLYTLSRIREDDGKDEWGGIGRDSYVDSPRQKSFGWTHEWARGVHQLASCLASESDSSTMSNVSSSRERLTIK